ncbi:MAG: hypothetical protein A2Z96_01420 [Spirochaetes bacterium GWB1_48_6]|nr:MAG: hypothetical protein A2Z96_01420 [Spirochaetes bacterium GWB1_48_6]
MKTYSTQPKIGEIHEPVTCPVCGDNRVKTHWDLGSFSFQSCKTCHHLYQNPRPKSTDLIGRYDEDYKSYEVENAGNFLNLMKLGLSDLGFEELESSLPPGKSFLDVGCATGTLVEYMKNRGWRAGGVEVCEGSAEYGRKVRQVDIHTGTLDSLNLPDDSLDVVHSSHVIEHVPEPSTFLGEIFRVLKPGGFCITVTPNTSSFQARAFGKDWRSTIPDHVHLFSQRGLDHLLKTTGFTVLRWKTWGGLALGMGPNWLKNPLDKAAKQFGFGDVMAVLVRKPER